MHLFEGENFLRWSDDLHLRTDEFAGSKKLHEFSASLVTVLALSVMFVNSLSTKNIWANAR